MYIPQDLKDKAIRKFTNRIDGKVLPHISVENILDYLESQQEPAVHNNILERFTEARLNELADINDEGMGLCHVCFRHVDNCIC